jgi:hypothetical protein
MRQTFGRNNSLFVTAGLIAWLELCAVINRAARWRLEYNNNNDNNNNNNEAYLLKSRTV